MTDCPDDLPDELRDIVFEITRYTRMMSRERNLDPCLAAVSLVIAAGVIKGIDNLATDSFMEIDNQRAAECFEWGEVVGRSYAEIVADTAPGIDTDPEPVKSA